MNSVLYEKWYTTHGSPSEGIWIGSGITTQYQMKANKNTPELNEDISTEFGYSLVKGRAIRLKLLCEKMEVEDDYE